MRPKEKETTRLGKLCSGEFALWGYFARIFKGIGGKDYGRCK